MTILKYITSFRVFFAFNTGSLLFKYVIKFESIFYEERKSKIEEKILVIYYQYCLFLAGQCIIITWDDTIINIMPHQFPIFKLIEAKIIPMILRFCGDIVVKYGSGLFLSKLLPINVGKKSFTEVLLTTNMVIHQILSQGFCQLSTPRIVKHFIWSFWKVSKNKEIEASIHTSSLEW